MSQTPSWGVTGELAQAHHVVFAPWLASCSLCLVFPGPPCPLTNPPRPPSNQTSFSSPPGYMWVSSWHLKLTYSGPTPATLLPLSDLSQAPPLLPGARLSPPGSGDTHLPWPKRRGECVEPEDGLPGPGVTLKGQGAACAVLSAPLALWLWTRRPSLFSVSPRRPHGAPAAAVHQPSDLSV